jgi:hypothetical protein
MFVNELSTNRKGKCEKNVDGSVFLLTLQEKLKAVAQELGHEVRVFSSEKFAAIPSKLPGADQGRDFFLPFALLKPRCLCRGR